jgi:large subunit ribosomal protein L17
MVTSLLEHERIQTTDAKAREVRRLAERMITLGKRGDLHARRQALAVIRSRAVTAKVFDELADRYRERPGGYTRVLKLGYRRGDAARVALVELVEPPAPAEEAAGPGKKKARRKAAGSGEARTEVSKPAAKKSSGRRAKTAS